MIGRGNGKPGTHSVPGYSHVQIPPKGPALSAATARTQKNAVQPKKNVRYRSKAQSAAIEKSLSYYLELTCGHYIAKEVREIYKVFGSIDIFCEICNNWMPPKEHVTKRDYPDNPLF